MPHEKIESVLAADLETLERNGTRKGQETVLTEVIPPTGNAGPRYLLQGKGEQAFLRMNSNSYLGLSLHREVVEAEEHAVEAYGTGPGAGGRGCGL